MIAFIRISVKSFPPNAPFWSLRKYQKTKGFLMFSRGSKVNIGKEGTMRFCAIFMQSCHSSVKILQIKAMSWLICNTTCKNQSQRSSPKFASSINPLSANPTKWLNTPKQSLGNLPTNCLSVFDHFVKLALKGLSEFKRIN